MLRGKYLMLWKMKRCSIGMNQNFKVSFWALCCPPISLLRMYDIGGSILWTRRGPEAWSLGFTIHLHLGVFRFSVLAWSNSEQGPNYEIISPNLCGPKLLIQAHLSVYIMFHSITCSAEGTGSKLGNAKLGFAFQCLQQCFEDITRKK